MPNWALAITLTQARASIWPASVVMTYSLPSWVKPPRPLKKARSRGGRCAAAASVGDGACARARARASSAPDAARRSTCSASVPAVVGKDHARDRLQQDAILFGHLLAAADEDAAGLVDRCASGLAAIRPDDLILQRLAIARVVFVPDDQIDGQPFHAPVGVGLDQLADQVDLGVIADAHQHDRQVAGDAVAPESRLPAAVLRQNGRARRGAGGWR